ncbi:MAG: chorismate synthase [Cytophagia bacterium]|nr:MAG: chorismate synthase [Cytophagia bacterium]TAG39228.1 MAG: chorismate synthase [Cytophagia bacterium]
MSNSYGSLFKITTFGESHGVAIGVIIDGCPAGLIWDIDFIQNALDRRKPGQSSIVTQRKEGDIVQVLSGVFENKTTGTPIALLIPNEDAKSKDYSHIATQFRPSHADYTYFIKYGHRDYRGGGRSSARETAARVAAGAVAQLFLKSKYNIDIYAYTSQVGNIKLERNEADLDFSLIEKTLVRCPDLDTASKMETLIKEVKKQGDTIGGVISAIVKNTPAGWGEPVFDKLHAELGKAMLSINAAKGFEYGSGFEGVTKKGSEHNDVFYTDEDGKVRTKTNFSGGIQGGISNGEDIYFRVAFKPVATLIQNQESINENNEKVIVEGKGRHDPCVLPRAVPIVEAMTALVLADFALRAEINRMDF